MKINKALATLRELVPADAGRKTSATADESAEEDDEEEFGSGSRKKSSANQDNQRQEKEFKLEILEKVVAYVQELQEKVRMFEVRGCVRCSSTDRALTQYSKRKRDEGSLSNDDDHDPHLSMDVAVERPNKRLTTTQAVPLALPHPNTRLPSISSWLPRSVPDSLLPGSRTQPINLSCPPASAVMGPITRPQVPQALHLELPMASLATRVFSTPTESASSSPSWTPEDESAASLLLRFKSSSSPKLVDTGKCQRPARSYP